MSYDEYDDHACRISGSELRSLYESRDRLRAENTRLREKMESTMSTKPLSNDQREFQEQNAATDQRNLNSDRWEALVEAYGKSEYQLVLNERVSGAFKLSLGPDVCVTADDAATCLDALADLLIAKRYERGEGNG